MFVRMADNSTSSHLPRRGGQRADRNADGRRAVVDSGELGTRPRSARTRSWMLPIMTWRASPRAAVLQAPSPRRARDAGRWRRGAPDASGCFLWSYRALFIRALGVREDQTARVPLELRRMTWLSPKQVLARCLAPDIEALTPVPAFQRSYLSDQHAALVPRGVCRQQCPHPCFLPAATGADSGSFAVLSDARATRRPGSAACSNWQRHTRDKSIPEPRAAAATPSTVTKRENTPLRRPRPSRRDPRLTAARGCRTSAARSANQISS